MFTAIEIENFKSLKHIELKMEKSQQPKKIVAIYGENGAGKSNLVSAFMNLSLSLRTIEQQKQWSTVQAKLDEATLAMQKLPDTVIPAFSAGQGFNRTLAEVFQNSSYMVGAKDPMRIRYSFKLNQHVGFYELTFKLNQEHELYLATEVLNYVIKKSSGTLFKLEATATGEIARYYSPSLFSNNETAKVITDTVERLWGKHTFLAILKDFQNENNQHYVEKNISSHLLQVLAHFSRIAFRTDKMVGVNKFSRLLRNLNQGRLVDNATNQARLATTQKALNQYFVPLYSEIMGISYQTKPGDGFLDYQLVVKKQSNGQTVTLPFSLESHGTKRLLDLFPLFLNAVHGETVIIDELDQGIHDLLIDRIVDNLQDDIAGQLIFTTHDTQVMQQLAVSSLYVIQTDVTGNKRVVNLSQASRDNIAAHNNVQKMYLNGYFSGIPYADDVDFYDIISQLGVTDD